jgi:hypothetical protein
MSRSVNNLPLQNKSQAYQRIEAILAPAGAAGVHGAHFVFTLFWPQFRARINEMNRLGWKIRGVDLPKREWVRGIRTKYVMDAKPLEVAPGEDWYEKLHGKRPGPHPWKKAFSEKRLADPDCFQLTPPEPRQ